MTFLHGLPPNRLETVLIGLAVACAIPHGTYAAQAPNDATEALVVVGTDTVRAEVASTQEARERGLMFREAVPEGTGMLFVFDRREEQGIWMKNTYVPLDVAFIDASYRIVSIESLEPMDETVKWSGEPVLFALEVRQGWFAERGIEPGQRVRIEFGRRWGRSEVDLPLCVAGTADTPT